MKNPAIKFILQLTLFILPVIILILYIENNLGHLHNSYMLKEDVLQKSNLKEGGVIILGSSQALHGIDPSVFRLKGINLANVSQSLYYDDMIYRKFSGQNKTPGNVIITLSYFSMRYQLYDSPESWRGFYYKRFNHLIPDHDLSIWDLRNYSLIALYTPLKTIKYISQHFHVNLTPGSNNTGYMAEFNNNPGRLDAAIGHSRVLLHNSLMKKSYVSSNYQYLQEIVHTASVNGNRIYIVMMPVHNSYAAFCDKAIVHETDSILQHLSATEHVTVLNLFSNNTMNDTDFFDSDHLNHQGAIKFSRQLDSLLYINRQ